MDSSIFIEVRPQLTVTADPPQILAGEFSQLHAEPEGGTPPFTFSWSPADSLDQPHDASPLATPMTTTTYEVTATDSVGAVRGGSVQVVVSGDLLIRVFPSATPTSIRVGETSQLDAVVAGGSPPYRYLWNPADSLSDGTIRNPVAAPTATQFYRVDVTDAQGHRGSGLLSVQVVIPPFPTASFVVNVTCCPEVLTLDASASTGNIVSYTWDLSWTPASADGVTTTPTTSFSIREVDRGTITLTVTRRSGPHGADWAKFSLSRWLRP